jgi:penicillin-binding protein 2
MRETDHGSSSGRMMESRQARDPRIFAFGLLVALLLLILFVGLAYRQLFQSPQLRESERLQTQRRVLTPGPRGNIYDRFGRLLVGNQPRFSVVLYLDELQGDFRRESIRIRNNYRATGDKELPNWSQMEQIAHASVAQNFLNQVDAITGRNDHIDARDLTRHFERQLYMPYTLVNDLTTAEFAELLEGLPVGSPLQLYTAVERYYPYGSAASHVLGYVGAQEAPAAEDFPGEDLKTFPMPGTIGRDGLEKTFDSRLQGQPGGSIFRVDPAGYKVNPPLEHRQPVQGNNLVSSLDIDLQTTAEEAIGHRIGAAVALDVRTGEVLTRPTSSNAALG